MENARERRRSPVWKWAAVGLSGVFPFIAIALLPVGAIVVRLNEIFDRLGPLGLLVFEILYVVVAVLLGPAWLLALVAGLAFGLVRGFSSCGSARRSRPRSPS